MTGAFFAETFLAGAFLGAAFFTDFGAGFFAAAGLAAGFLETVFFGAGLLFDFAAFAGFFPVALAAGFLAAVFLAFAGMAEGGVGERSMTALAPRRERGGKKRRGFCPQFRSAQPLFHSLSDVAV